MARVEPIVLKATELFEFCDFNHASYSQYYGRRNRIAERRLAVVSG
jgi:hypothetical protein